MAEALTVVGAVASTLQLMEYTIRVFDRINHYVRQVDETPEMLRYVGLHLQFFIQSLQRVQDHIDYGHFNPQTSSMIKMFIDECYSQMILLDDIMTKITPVNGDSKMTRSLRAMESLKQEKALEKIVSRISSYVEKLLLFQNAVISGSTMANTKLVLKQWENAGHPWLPLTTDSLPAGGGEELVADTRDTLVQNKKTSVSSEGLLIPSMQCKKRRFSYFLGLTRLGLLWAFQAGLDISWGNGISIIPSLHLQPLVKHTSAGFQVVYNCYTSQLGLRSSSDALLRLFQTGRISPQDVFPDGVTWLEVCKDTGAIHPKWYSNRI
ncbi:hypothetical protein N7528_005210 [Penicillium herquei]|nr:hypothetical protein N7528_005210 [Penicillium herquei]